MASIETNTQCIGIFSYELSNDSLTFFFKFFCRYNKLAAEIRNLARKLTTLETEDEFRNECSALLIEKLYSIGLIQTKRLRRCNDISVSSFCRRRLPVYMIKSGMFNGPLEIAGL